MNIAACHADPQWIVGENGALYRTPADILRDDSLEPGDQIALLQKWLDVTVRNYRNVCETDALMRTHAIEDALGRIRAKLPRT